jgi:regulator of PEP synthase PpsR (kinase-PPPase family)
MNTEIHVHLVSDATGETNHQVVRACLAHFKGVKAHEHVWSLVRTEGHIDKVIAAVESYPGPVVFTLVDSGLRRRLEEGCKRVQAPCIAVLDPLVKVLAEAAGTEGKGRPGAQHEMDSAYFDRIEAMDYTLAHDDGQVVHDLDDADIVLVGVSRTSKTPTSLYLANKGFKTANIPVVPEVPLPDELFHLKKSLVVALTNDPVRLAQIRRSRMRMLKQDADTDYVDLDQVRKEVADARRMFSQHGWPIIDVTRRSIEETAAAVLQRFEQFHGRESGL